MKEDKITLFIGSFLVAFVLIRRIDRRQIFYRRHSDFNRTVPVHKFWDYVMNFPSGASDSDLQPCNCRFVGIRS